MRETAAQRFIARAERIPAVAAGAALGVFALVLLVVPAFSVSYDEAKYLSMGASVWAGDGPRTAFGYLFLQHSPLWMTLVYAPTALFGADTLAWGHLLDGLAGIGVIGLAAVMGRRISPAAGVVAAFAMLAFGYLLALTLTTRLDVPVAFLALLYLEVGWRALRLGSRRWGAAAGIVFATAVLVKEVAIPLAPVPMLCAVLAGVDWTRVFRAAGWLALTAILGLAPWFIYYAQETGRVYRLGTPAWTLPLFALPVLCVIVVGLAVDLLAAGGRLKVLAVRLTRPSPAWATGRGRVIIGWGVALAWCVALTFFFSRIARIAGAPLVQPAQYRLYLQAWALELAPVAAFVAMGLALAVALLATDRTAPERRGVANALMATICGVPLVLMVVAVGEPPRNYVAQVATAVVVAAGGWSWGVARLIGRLARSGRHATLARYGMPVFLALVMVAGAGAVSARGWVTREVASATRTTAAQTAVTWIREHVPKGTSLAFGAYLSYEMAYQLVPDYRMTQVQAKLSGFDLSMPLGFKWGSAPADDWVAADIAPRNVNQFEAYRASWVHDELTSNQVAYWIYATGATTSAPSILAQLTPDHGFQEVAQWRFEEVGDPLTVSVFRVDLTTVALDVTKLYISPEALSRVVTRLAADPVAGKPVAAALIERVVVVPDGGSAAGDLARLKALAGN